MGLLRRGFGAAAVLALLPASVQAAGIVKGDAVFKRYSDKNVKRGGILRSPILSIRGLDPHQETGDATTYVTNLTNNLLIRMNQTKTGVEPDLAKSWKQIDPLTYEFKLHQGVKFHNVPPVNGRELTSADVKYSLERMMGQHGKPAKFKHRYYFAGRIAAIETPDKHTVVIKTKEPYGALINFLASSWSAIVAKEVVDKHGDLQRVAVGTGPFIMTEYVKGSHLKFRKNPDYFKKGLPYLDGIELKDAGNPAATLAGYLAGKFDITGLYFFQLKTLLEKSPDSTVTALPGSHMWTLRTPAVIPGKIPARKPFDDVRVRRALAMAIDKEMLLKLAWGGFGETQVGPIPGSMGPWALPKSDQIQYNPEKAKKLLAEAGYPNGFTTELMTWNAPFMVKPAQVVQGMLAKVGVKANLKLLEFAQYFNKAYRFKYDMALHLMASAADPEALLSPYFGSPAKSTMYKWPNKEIQDLIDEQSKILDEKKRIAMVHDIQRKLLEDAPNVFLYTQTRYQASRPYVHMKNYSHSLQSLLAEEWWMDKPGASAAH